MITSLSEKIKFIEDVFGPGRLARNCKNLDIRCPICAPSDHSKRKLSVFVEDDRCHCWTCGFKSRNLVPLIRKYFRSKLAEYCDRFVPKALFDQQKITDENKDEQIISLPNDFTLLGTGTHSNPDAKQILRYLLSRGITERDIWYYKFGFSNEMRWSRRAIMPSFDENGTLNYFVSRAIDARTKPKYDNPDLNSLNKRQIIFNEINVNWSKQLVLCEGPFDLVKCGDNAVPLLGSTLSEESLLFTKILENSTPVALALDADMWLTKTPFLAKKFIQYDIDIKIVDTRSFDDPGKATKTQFKEALKNAKAPSWLNTFYDKLQEASKTRLMI